METINSENTRIVSTLSDIIERLQDFAATSDFYSGYSLAEVIQERLAEIGAVDEKVKTTSKGNLTKYAELEKLKSDVTAVSTQVKNLIKTLKEQSE